MTRLLILNPNSSLPVTEAIAHVAAACLPTGTHTDVLDYVTARRPDLTPYLDAGRRAIERGARVVVLGCAGMAPAARALERELGVAVVEPVEAGIREAAPASAGLA